jgi:predicted branched-subunit amino acid permease
MAASDRASAQDAEPGGSACFREGFLGGMRAGAGLGAVVFILGLTFGALARAHGWGLIAPLACSAVVFSSSAQFTLLTVLTGGGAIPAAVAAASLINARFLSMGLSVAPSLKGGRWRRSLEGQAVVDGSWVLAHLGGGRFDRARLMGATAVAYPAWIGGTALGMFLAPTQHQIAALGLDLMFPAYFLVMLIDELRLSVQARYAALISAALAAGLVFILPSGLAVIGATAAALLGLADFPWRSTLCERARGRQSSPSQRPALP